MRTGIVGVLAGLFFAVACLMAPITRAEEFIDTTGSIKWKVYDYGPVHLRSRIPHRVTEGIAFDFSRNA